MWSFIISGLMAAYVMVGFDSAGELSEETKHPRRTAPRTILRALVVSGIGGALMLLATMMAAPSTSDGSLGDVTKGLPYVVLSRLGNGWGRVFLVDVAIAVCVCTLAIQTATTRMIFSMARDRVLPFSGTLSAVNARTGAPVMPAIVSGVLTAALLLVDIGNASVFLALSSVCIMLLYIAYLMVTMPLLRRRLQGWPTDGDAQQTAVGAGDSLFSLGRFAVPVNVVAIVWGIGMAINLAWPRQKVYGTAWYLQFFPEICLIGTIVLGVVAYVVQRAQLRTEATDIERSLHGTSTSLRDLELPESAADMA
jgi:urea carboxylase system permease